MTRTVLGIPQTTAMKADSRKYGRGWEIQRKKGASRDHSRPWSVRTLRLADPQR